MTAATPVIVFEVTKSAIEPILNAAPALVERFAAVLERRQADSTAFTARANGACSA